MKLLDIILEDENKEKLIKKAKTIYKGVKTGVVRKGVFGKVVYVLPDVYDVQIDIHDEIFIKVGGNRTENGVKFYYVDDTDGEMKPLRVNPTEYQLNIKRIENKKFTPFGIYLWYEESDNWEKPEVVNENEDSDRTRKRVKNVYRALKKGIVHRNANGVLYYQLPDHYEYKEKGYGDPAFPVVFVGNQEDENHIRFFQQDHGTSKEDRKELNLAAYDYNSLFSQIGVLFDKFNISFQRH
jgi:hypothetical protein